jgi:hypothetical protein
LRREAAHMRINIAIGVALVVAMAAVARTDHSWL